MAEINVSDTSLNIISSIMLTEYIIKKINNIDDNEIPLGNCIYKNGKEHKDYLISKIRRIHHFGLEEINKLQAGKLIIIDEIASNAICKTEIETAEQFTKRKQITVSPS